jgi:hypothetical protein
VLGGRRGRRFFQTYHIQTPEAAPHGTFTSVLNQGGLLRRSTAWRRFRRTLTASVMTTLTIAPQELGIVVEQRLCGHTQTPVVGVCHAPTTTVQPSVPPRTNTSTPTPVLHLVSRLTQQSEVARHQCPDTESTLLNAACVASGGEK